MEETQTIAIHSQIPPDLIPNEQCAIYREVVQRALERHIRFAVGGAFAFAFYTGQWRNTKDLDLYVLPEDRAGMIDVLNAAGLADYYDQSNYDRSWIYRGIRGDNIVDVIWAMANKRAMVDPVWLDYGSEGELCGERLPLIAPEEYLWAQLYIIQRDRTGWPDIFNLLAAAGPALDWAHILERVGEDWPLLSAVLSTFAWLSARRAADLPLWLWDHLHLERPHEFHSPDASSSATECSRAALLDSRPWFGPVRKGGQNPC
jgi:hypothetical protein